MIDTRRQFLAAIAALPLPAARDDVRKPLRGIFPILQTPFTDDDNLDVDTLVAQARFCHRAGIHGMVWPQLASEWFTLKPGERRAGAEALAAVAPKLRPALVLGVQGPDLAAAVEYARHAEKLAPDAIIALPPPGVTDNNKQFEYYKAIGAACSRPLFVQAVGKMPVDFLIEMARAVPTLRYIKDEAGPPLPRISEFRRKAPELHSFTGNHGRTLYDEMLRGSAGSMPAAGFADLYAQAWDHFQAGRKKQAVDFCARATLLVPMMETYGIQAMKFILKERGVFRNDRTRTQAAITVNDRQTPFDDEGRAAIRELLSFLKPNLRG